MTRKETTLLSDYLFEFVKRYVCDVSCYSHASHGSCFTVLEHHFIFIKKQCTRNHRRRRQWKVLKLKNQLKNLANKKNFFNIQNEVTRVSQHEQNKNHSYLSQHNS
jgi:hypothetical protein